MTQHHIISKKACFIFFLGILAINLCVAQGVTNNTRYELESGIYISTSGQNPFLLRSNQYGIIPLESQFLTLRGATHKEYDSTKNEQNKQKRFSYGYGLSTVVNVSKAANQIILPEAYLKMRYGAFEFYGGRRKEIVGLVDTTLTSGSYIWSGNALPIPKLQISIPNYISIIGKGLISIKGAYAHGWFGSSDSTKKFFLHQKYLYGRIGKPNWRLKFYIGFNHQVQWGGKPHKPYIESQTGKLITNYGNDFSTYLNVVSGVSLNKIGDGASKDGIPINEAWNRSGNHLGSIDIATEISFNKFDLLLYRQSIYDDGSLFYLNNITDGLFGFSLRRKKAKKGLVKVGFEYLNTISQGGSQYYDIPPQLRGNDNYFNNSIYSWLYKNNAIGTPYILPINSVKRNIIDDNIMLKNKSQAYFINNRTSVITAAVDFILTNKYFTTRISKTVNLGTYAVPIQFNQFSILQSINYSYKEYIVKSQISYDSNGIFNSTLGLSIILLKNF